MTEMRVRAVRGSMHYRFEAIRPIVTDKTVLDIGAGIGHWRRDWLHGSIAAAASESMSRHHAG